MERSFATITSVDEITTAWRQSNAPIAPSWKVDARKERNASARDAEGLVLVDADRLDPAQAAAAERLADLARQSGVPIFDVRSHDVALGRSLWDSADGLAPTSQPGAASSPALMRVSKMRRSAFADTRLGLLLRTNDIRHVTVAGADLVPGSLAATVLDALDADYAVTVAKDACADAGWPPLERTGVDVSASADIGARWRSCLGRRVPLPGNAESDLKLNFPA
jgi:nicotinamidase-related amidase